MNTRRIVGAPLTQVSSPPQPKRAGDRDAERTRVSEAPASGLSRPDAGPTGGVPGEAGDATRIEPGRTWIAIASQGFDVASWRRQLRAQRSR